MTINRNLSILANGVSSTGVLGVPNGGTGQSSALVAGAIVYGATTTAMGVTLAGTTGQVLTSQGAGTPTWTTPTTGTVTSVAALTLGTSGTDLTSTVATSTTTPVITLNVPTASASNRGALSSTDWTTFNNKAPGVTFTTGYIPYGQGTTTLNQSTNLYFDGANFLVGTTTSPTSGYGYFAVKGAGSYFSFGSQQNGGSSFVVFNSSGVGVYLPSGNTAWLPATSDKRLKNKVSDISNALNAINKLNPLSFYYKNQAQNGLPQYGYFAQDVGAAIPDAMVISPNPDPVLGTTYTYDPSIINVYLVAALQELSNKFDAYVASHP